MIFRQIADPANVASTLEGFDCPKRTLAAAIGLTLGMLSLWFNGSRGLSYESQYAVLEFVRFARKLSQESDVPVDFRQTEKIMKLYTNRYRECLEEQVLKLDSELKTSGQGDSE